MKKFIIKYMTGWSSSSWIYDRQVVVIPIEFSSKEDFLKEFNVHLNRCKKDKKETFKMSGILFEVVDFISSPKRSSPEIYTLEQWFEDNKNKTWK